MKRSLPKKPRFRSLSRSFKVRVLRSIFSWEPVLNRIRKLISWVCYRGSKPQWKLMPIQRWLGNWKRILRSTINKTGSSYCLHWISSQLCNLTAIISQISSNFTRELESTKRRRRSPEFRAILLILLKWF